MFQYIFASPYDMDGPKIAVLRVDVIENQGESINRAYNLRSVEYKNTPLSWVNGEKLRAGFQDQATASGDYTISVADLVANVKEDYVGNHVDISGKAGAFSIGRFFSELVGDIRPQLVDELGVPSSLLKRLENGEHIDQRMLSNEVFDALAIRGDMDIDEQGRVYRKIEPTAEGVKQSTVPDILDSFQNRKFSGSDGSSGVLEFGVSRTAGESLGSVGSMG